MLVFWGAVIQSYDQLLPMFLRSIEEMDLDKRSIVLHLVACSSSLLAQKRLQDWTEAQEGKYLGISWENSSASEGEIKDLFLQRAQSLGCSFCFLVDSSVFLTPCTLRELLLKKAAVISPTLRPIPEPRDAACNFFYDLTGGNQASGYLTSFLEDRYFTKSNRLSFATEPVAGAFGAYLIGSQAMGQLNFTQEDRMGAEPWFSFAFSAKEKGIELLICNEREFGFFLHFSQKTTLEEKQSFCLADPEAKIDRAYAEEAFKGLCEKDHRLKEHIDHFDFEKYAIYRVQNKTLFYLDDAKEYIKTNFLKRGILWEGHLQELFQKYVRPGSTVVDVGGHIGVHTLFLSKLLGHTGTVHVFEPQVKLFSELVLNARLNKCSNVHFHRRALGNGSMHVGMSCSKPENEGTAKVLLEGDGKETVEMHRLDDLRLNDVSLMKIDVEGFEKDVLEGARETILLNQPVLIVEIWEANLEKVSAFLSLLSYEMFSLGGEDYLCCPQGSLFQNLAFF